MHGKKKYLTCMDIYQILNKGWVTGGFKVPLDDLADLFEVWEFEE